MPVLSIVTPAYNAEKYIEETIRSILAQTFKDYEFIIIDDCSTDRTYAIAQEYANKDARIRLYRNEKNLYIAGNRNRGITLAQGKYLMWQDADDIALPERARKLVDFMERHPDVGICGSYLQSFCGNELLDIRKYAEDDASLRKNIFKYSPVAQPSAMIRRECFERVGTFNEDFPPAEDIEMSFRIGQYYKFANLPEVLLKYREHPNSATFKKLNKMLRSTLEARKRFMHNSAYTFRFSDYIAYGMTWFMQILPPYLVINLFKLSRALISTLKL